MNKNICVTTLKIINKLGVNVMHAMKEEDEEYNGFGEAYFSLAEYGAIKAWKRHRKMTLNIIVPVGEIRFVLFDNRLKHDQRIKEVILSKNNYSRLTIPPMIWVGFQGLSMEESILLNIADIMHDASEADKKNVEEIKFNWEIKNK